MDKINKLPDDIQDEGEALARLLMLAKFEKSRERCKSGKAYTTDEVRNYFAEKERVWKNQG